MLLAKAPALGRVKTRLVPPLSPAQALLLHEAMLLDQIRFLRRLASPEFEVEVRVDGPLPPGAVPTALRGIPVRAQGDGDLGARMRRAAEEAFAAGAGRAGLLGGDAPTLPAALVRRALERVRDDADAAVVPALDGGYVFLVLRPGALGLLEQITWGSPLVLAETRSRASAAGLRLEETEAWGDLDSASDLARTAGEAERDPARASATRAFLSGLGMDFGDARVL